MRIPKLLKETFNYNNWSLENIGEAWEYIEENYLEDNLNDVELAIYEWEKDTIESGCEVYL